MEKKNREHTFHVFQVSVLGLREGEDAGDLIWSLISNPEKYEDGVSKLAGKHDGTGFQVELREVVIDDVKITGCIAKCREDAPPLRRGANKQQVLQHLQPGDSFLEKNYFRYDRASRALMWQFNLGGNGYRSFGQMLSVLSGMQRTFSCDPIVEPGHSLNQDCEIEYVDFKVVMPTARRTQRELIAQDPTDWAIFNPFSTMQQAEARQFEAKVTSKRNTSLGDKVTRFVTALSDNSKHVRRLRLKLEDQDEPIDMLTKRFKSRKAVEYHGHHLNEASMLAALEEAWNDYQQQAAAN